MSDINPIAFRKALGSFTTGVTVITTKDANGKLCGLTANSFNSVSLEPPLVLWSIGKSSSNYQAFINAEFWNVHILATDQETVANNFARKGGDKFLDIDFAEGTNGAPVVGGCTAVMECQLEHQYEGGDHVILVGRVLRFDVSSKEPLVFSRGGYTYLAGDSWRPIA